jgi:hypothetical protein
MRPVRRVAELGSSGSMRRFFQILHHKSLTLSIATLPFSVLALGGVLSLTVQPRFPVVRFPLEATVVLLVCALVCTVTLMTLLKDEKSGYSSTRLSVAILVWGFACFPVAILSFLVIREIVKYLR